MRLLLSYAGKVLATTNIWLAGPLRVREAFVIFRKMYCVYINRYLINLLYRVVIVSHCSSGYFGLNVFVHILKSVNIFPLFNVVAF